MSSTNKVYEILKEVIKYGQINVLKEILQTWSNPNLHDVMKIAIQYGTLDTLEAVIQHGADINDTEENTRNTVLHHAIIEGKPEMVEFLVKSKIKQIPNRYGNEPLHVALNCLMANAKEYKVFQEIVLFLIDNGADLNAKNREGNTPHDIAFLTKDLKIVHYLNITKAKKNTLQALLKGQCSKFNNAIRNGNLELVQELLLTEDISTDRVYARRATLNIAIIHRHFEIAKFLRQYGATLENTKDDPFRSNSLLSNAIRNQDVEMVEVLVEFGALKYANRHPIPFVFHAIEKKNLKIVDILLKNGTVDINHNYESFGTALHYFSSGGLMLNETDGILDGVKFLIKHCNAKQLADHEGKTPLHIAIKSQNYEIAKFLLENEADVNAIDNNKQSPLHLLAIYRSNSENHVNDQFAKLLINNGANVNALDDKNQSPLKIAIEKDNYSLVEILIESGAKINGSKYNKAIFQALESTSTKYLKILLNHGANADCVREGDEGRSLLHIAVLNQNLDMIKVLANVGAISDITDYNEETPLHYCSKRGYLQVAKLLIDNGAQMNIQNKNGLSPLHSSVQKGYKDITELLLQNGANINVTDSENRTPLYYAVSCIPLYHALPIKAVDFVKLLIEKGADLSIKS